ncbi:hypothetical protein OOT33_02165 [Sphingobium sp. DEHP117]|uniref:hypothetical protein n=1 Tax=Sphingobium sp. DEHP117 TaxID=2993436 RepID=UPI001B6DAD65|nr:hypothetical protein [Sphingobium sp. DEHP117]MBP8670816.1 hypothetical protein [Sphingobium sp.]MBP9158121.1 hypothetical protein [Sphingobium sp.]MDQ4419245.1 hypothetical protein [Sphingobium sp. DEHP117]
MSEEIVISHAGIINLCLDAETLMQLEVGSISAAELMDKGAAVERISSIGKLACPIVSWHECEFEILENGDAVSTVKFVGYFACNLIDPDHVLQVVSCPDEIEGQDAFHPLSWKKGKLVIYYSLAGATMKDARKEFESVITAYRKSVDHLCHLVQLYNSALPYLATKLIELRAMVGVPPNEYGRTFH